MILYLTKSALILLYLTQRTVIRLLIVLDELTPQSLFRQVLGSRTTFLHVSWRHIREVGNGILYSIGYL